MAGENDNLIEGILGMLGDNPEEKINELLGSLKNAPQTSEQNQISENLSLPDIDISSLLSLKNAFSPGGTEDDNTRLLAAIKPFLNDRRKPHLDRLLRLLKLANVAQKAGGMDILKNLGI